MFGGPYIINSAFQLNELKANGRSKAKFDKSLLTDFYKQVLYMIPRIYQTNKQFKNVYLVEEDVLSFS